jgi:hypothetical protein
MLAASSGWQAKRLCELRTMTGINMRALLAASALALVAIACSSGPAETGSTPASEPPKAAGDATSGPRAETACEVLTPAEVASFLNVPEVRKDDLNSGKNQFTGVDLCNWYVKEGSPEGIGVTLRRATSDDDGGRMSAFSAAKGDAVEHDVKRSQEAQPVAVGDEALYSPYPVPPGGSIVVRVGSVVVTLAGSASKDTFIAMAKLAAGRI